MSLGRGFLPISYSLLLNHRNRKLEIAACKAAGSHNDLEQIIWGETFRSKRRDPAEQKIPTQADRSPCFSSEQVQ